MSEISEQVLKISTSYLGPAASHFLERQAKNHMNGIEFSQIERTHLPELAKWVNISASLVVGAEKSKKLADEILKI